MIFALAVVVMFVGSTIALVFYAEKNQTPNNNNRSNNNNNNTPAQALPFESQEFDAKVIDLLPEMTIIGQTKETNPNSIDSELSKVQGIKAIKQAKYAGTPSTTLTYRIILSLQAGAKASDVFASIQANSTKLSQLQGVISALVELPSKIIVTNSDLNISKEFSPNSRITMAYVSLDTEKNDVIKASLSVSIANDISSNLVVFENSNPNSQPQQFSQKASAKVVSLEKKLYVQGTMNYNNYIDENSLKALLESSEFSINFLNSQELQKSLAVTVQGIDENYDLNLVKDKLDALSIKDLNSFALGKGSADFTIDISFNDNTDLNALEKSVKEALESLNFTEDKVSFQEPEAGFMLDLNLSSENSTKADSFFKQVLEGRKITYQAFQPLSVDLKEVYIIDLNSTLPIDSNSVQVFAKPNHSISDEISFTLQVQVQRGKIIQAQGIEE